MVSRPRGRSSLRTSHVSLQQCFVRFLWIVLCSIFFSILSVLLCWQEPCRYRAAKRRTRASTSVSPRMLLEQSTPMLQCCTSKVSQSTSWEDGICWNRVLLPCYNAVCQTWVRVPLEKLVVVGTEFYFHIMLHVKDESESILRRW